MWFDRKSDVSMLKVFGCTAIAHVPSQKRRKLDDKGMECILVGYAVESKAYRLYCKSSKKIIISRDVDFIENEFKNSSNDKVDDDFYIELHSTVCETEGDICNHDVLPHTSNQIAEVENGIIDAEANNEIADINDETTDNDFENTMNNTIVQNIESDVDERDDTMIDDLNDTMIREETRISTREQELIRQPIGKNKKYYQSIEPNEC